MSLGSLLFRVALAAALSTAADVRAGWPVDAGVVTYDEVQSLSGR
ncbi:hypothetical protein AB0436_10790 [Streptomyces sp. NPDC051322]